MIGDIISAVSVLLIFLTFLMNGIKENIDKLLGVKKESAKKNLANELNKKLISTLFLQALPVTIIFLSVFWIIFPKAWTIVKTSHISLWSFNEMNTLYVLIELGLLGMLLFAGVKTIQVLLKWFEKRS